MALCYRMNRMDASTYIELLRTIYKLRTVVSIKGVFTQMCLSKEGVPAFYDIDNKKITDSRYLKDLRFDAKVLDTYTTLLLDGGKMISVTTLIKKLYEEVVHGVVDSIGDLARYNRSHKNFNLIPNFTTLYDYDNMDDACKLDLLYKYQYLYNIVNKFKDDDRLVPHYDIKNDSVTFSVEIENDNIFTGTPLYGTSIEEVLLPTVAFSGTCTITVKKVLDNIRAVIRYIMRLHSEAVSDVYTFLYDEVLTTVDIDTCRGQVNYVDSKNINANLEGDVIVVDDIGVKLRIAKLNDWEKVKCFVDAVNANKDMLHRPIVSCVGTVASAVLSYMRYRYESTFKEDVANSSRYINKLLLSMTSIGHCGDDYIHQGVNAFMIAYKGNVYTDSMNQLDMLLAYIQYCKDVYVTSFTWDTKHLIKIQFKHKADDCISVIDYIRGEAFCTELDSDEVIYLLQLIRKLVFNFYHTWNSNYNTVFIDALDGFKLISEVSKLSDNAKVYFDYETGDNLNYATNVYGIPLSNDTILAFGDMVIPMCGKYTKEDLKHAKFMTEIHNTKYKPLKVLLRTIINTMFTVFESTNASDIKSVSIGVEGVKHFDKLSFSIKTHDGKTKIHNIDVPYGCRHTVFGFFHEDSGYHIYDVSLHRLLEILNEVRELMFNSYTYFGYTVGDNFDTLDSDMHKLGVVVNCCENSYNKEEVVMCEVNSTTVCTDNIKYPMNNINMSNPTNNINMGNPTNNINMGNPYRRGRDLSMLSDTNSSKVLARDLALEFINSGYDVVMRDGDNLVVYAYEDNRQEYIPNSLRRVFYDIDKVELLPLTYYVFMCK